MSEPRRIPLSEPNLEGNALRYLEECIATNFVSSVGPFVSRFEEEFAAFVGSRYAIACSSGTAAIHVALRLLELGVDDEVFVPTLTFIASGNPVLYEKATPVLVDSEPVTWNLDPALVAEELDRRARSGRRQPRAVEAVHILGHPADLTPLVEACARHGVALIEDAAEALGARYTAGPLTGRHVGTIGQLGCFSFNGNKVMTTGGGGMIVTDDEKLARRARHLTTQARLPGIEYRHDEVGYNYRLTNVAAALGVAQLERLPAFLEAKRAIAARYDQGFEGRPGIAQPPRAPWAAPSWWLYTITIDPTAHGRDREAARAALAARGVEARPIWTPLHHMPMYRDAPRLGGAVADRLHAQGLSLPSSVSLTPSDQALVIQSVCG